MFFFKFLNRIKKINFFFEENADLVYLDENLSDLKFLNKKAKVLKFDELNFIIFIKTIFIYIFKDRSISFKHTYFKNLLKQINPKIVIGNNLNQRIFLVKKILPSILTICYQFGFLDKKNIHKIYNKKNKYFLCDFFLVFHKQDRLILKNYFDSNFIIAGSIRNNNYFPKNNFKKKYVHYISQYNPKRPKWDKHHFYQSFLLNILKNYCKKKKLILIISPRSNRIDKPLLSIDQERKYFCDMIGNSFIFSKKSPYELANFCVINITLHSNLGFELLSRGEKVFFFQPNKNIYYYPYKIKKKNYHFYNKLKKEVIEKKINFLVNLKKEKWKNYLNKVDKIHYDKKNIILKNIINMKL